MNRRQGWVLLSLGIVLALGTGALVFFLLQQQQRTLSVEAERMAAEQVAPVVATMDLPVAARPLQPGAVITSDDVLMKPFPLDLVPVAAITDTISLRDQILIAPIGQGETFSTGKLAGGEAGTISQQIEPGQVIFAFPISDLLTQVDILADGDRIDMLMTMPVISADGTESHDVTAYTLQNINIFRVLRPSLEADQPPIALLLTMTPEDALMLKRLKDSGGKIDFVLRPITDREPVEVPPVTDEVLVSRYGLR
ncbi:Flp pilus assembly protein CpaB [Oscillochloris sp. ZM17-4]|uniref:Flp pilus assembly protein CpaB n=1 Tax=Oscillochloris sp. ZM17-4 TaxID=2866714 RepID=UPI001C73A98F|nr:Flp pilus assembly protein CpaB [Oscillochloris sp. ZM17-4]MBX0327046.1 Flp pilus assembly protein CpaB [Oscillochloris sp. ZM17-4]